VKNRTIGLVTGAVLTVLGAAMLILNFWEQLSQISLFVDILHCFGVLAAYIIPSVLVLLPIRFLTSLPSFIFRKLLHIVAFTCVSLMILAAHSWQAAALASVIIAAVIYPLLMAAEHERWYPRLFVEKKPGEIKKSMLMLFLMFAALIAVCWGVFGKPQLAATAILMWGTGDAAAALVGIPFGKHKVKSKLTDGKKSWEGSTAMLIVSLMAGTGMLTLAQGMSVLHALPISFLAALLGTATELFSPSEYDTVTVPTVIAAALLLLNHL
jgi:dolichol kinase